MSNPKDLIIIEGLTWIHDTGKAILVLGPGSVSEDEAVWIPWTHIGDHSHTGGQGGLSATLPYWLIKQHDWESFIT